VTDEHVFPGGEPVFGVLYGGMGHEAAGMLALVQLPLFFVLPVMAAWLLSRTDRRVLSSYGKKLLFFVVVGLLIGISSRLMDFGIGSYPPGSAILLCIHDIILWTVAGMLMAWMVKPGRPAEGRS
jgi:hypothetical protein